MAITNLNDLDELLSSVRDRNSREYIAEAVSAYRARAYRAAITSAWIAVTYDIIAKIRELALQGDTAAKRFTTRLENVAAAYSRGDPQSIQSMQSIENSLLNDALNTFAFLSHQEYRDLDRLKEDRNLCAHPAFTDAELLFQPTPEQVRAHLAHAILHLLSQRPIQGKSALERLKADLKLATFPTTEDGVRTYLDDKYLSVAKDSFTNNVVPFLLVLLLKSTDPDLVGKEANILRCLGAFRDLRPAVYRSKMEGFSRLCESLSDADLKRIAILFDFDPRCWGWCGPAIQERLKEVIRSYRLESADGDYIFSGLAIEDLKPGLMAIVDALDEHQKVEIISRVPRAEFVDQAITLYVEATSWRGAEARAERLILPLTHHLQGPHIRRIVDAVIENYDIRTAHGTPAQIAQLFEKTSAVREDAKADWQRLRTSLQEANCWGSFTQLDEALDEAGI